MQMGMGWGRPTAAHNANPNDFATEVCLPIPNGYFIPNTPYFINTGNIACKNTAHFCNRQLKISGRFLKKKSILRLNYAKATTFHSRAWSDARALDIQMVSVFHSQSGKTWGLVIKSFLRPLSHAR